MYVRKPSIVCLANPRWIPLRFSQSVRFVLLFFLLLGTHGCASEREPLTFSGFLDNYSGLRPAPDESGAWTYKKPGVDFRPYTKIMLDPLVIWPSPNSTYRGLHTGSMWQLALAFQDQMSKALQDGYTIVQEPGPDVLRLRAALTEVILVRPSRSAPGPLLPMVGDIVLFTAETLSGTTLMPLTGEAAIELELLDSQTHVRLAAYIEKRKSEKIVITKETTSLGPIRGILNYWARKLRQRLDEERGLSEYRKDIR